MKKKKEKPLAILSNEDLNEYKRRRQLLDQAKMQMMACAAYCDMFHAHLRIEYKLPQRFELNLDDGHVKEEEDSAEAANM